MGSTARKQEQIVGQLKSAQLSVDRRGCLRLLEEAIPLVMLDGPLEHCFDITKLVLDLGVESRAIRIFEEHPRLSAVLRPGGKILLDQQRMRTIRYSYARIIAREGFVGQGLELIRAIPPAGASDWMVQGWFKMACGNLAAARTDFESAHRLAPDDIITRGSFLHALAYDGDPRGAEKELRAIRSSGKFPEHDAWLANRHAEALRLVGRLEEAREVIQESLSHPLQRVFDRGFALHILGSIAAAAGDPEKARGYFGAALKNIGKSSKGYTSQIWVFNRMMECGLAGQEGMSLLRALHGKVTGHELPAHCVGAVELTPASSCESPLLIDLGRNEYQLSGTEQRQYACPLELQMVAWIAVISPCFIVPRSLLIELLWPKSLIRISVLQARLTQLLGRIEKKYGIDIRDPGTGAIRLKEAALSQLRIKFNPVGLPPSCVESGGYISLKSFARYYGISERAAQKHLRNAKARFGLKTAKVKA